MSKAHTLITKVPKEGQPYKIAVKTDNIVEVTPKGDTESWLKYWDGAEVRSCIVTERPEHFC